VSTTDNMDNRDSVAALIRTVGRRPAPPREDYERVLAASRAAWQRTVQRRRRRRFTYALAAGVAFVLLGASLWQRLDRATDMVAGTLTTTVGGVFAGGVAGDEWRWLTEAGTPMMSGTRLRTDASGRAVMQLELKTSLRIAGSTDLLLGAGNRVVLLDGRIYLDTHGASHGAIEIETRFGTLRDIGTQFEVLATGTTLRVRTREGAVTLTRAHSEQVLQCAVSEELRIDERGRIERGRIAAHDADWAWVELLAKPPRGPDLPLSRFLDWVARETGRRVVYDSAQTEARVGDVVLHGSPPDLTPVQAMDVALATTDFDYSLLADGTIMLRPRQSS
jgi:ferric-dicitrate binding protein FerR (iron transport regulator)